MLCWFLPYLNMNQPDILLTSCDFHLEGASQVALVVKNPAANARDIGDARSIPAMGRSPGEGNGNQLQYSCLENLSGGIGSFSCVWSPCVETGLLPCSPGLGAWPSVTRARALSIAAPSMTPEPPRETLWLSEVGRERSCLLTCGQGASGSNSLAEHPSLRNSSFRKPIWLYKIYRTLKENGMRVKHSLLSWCREVTTVHSSAWGFLSS